MSALGETTRPTQFRQGPGRFVLAGTVLGLAWGCSFRAWMSLLAIRGGSFPDFSWDGTFGVVILPAAIIGGVLGWAAHARRSGGHRYWRYAALAPLLFIVFAFVYRPNFIQVLRSTGEGSGALGVVAIGLAGGYGFSGRGPLWGRISAGLPAAGVVAVFSIGVAISEGWAPREAFVALTFALLMVLWIGACSIPHREVEAPD